jgi:hypothetical protein
MLPRRFMGLKCPSLSSNSATLMPDLSMSPISQCVVEIEKKRDVPSEIIAKWGIGVALFMTGDRWVEMFPQGLADLGELLHWTVTELWEHEPHEP